MAGVMQALPRPQDMDGRPKSRLSVLIVSEMLPVGGIKIANCEFFTDRRSLSRTKTGIQTPY